MEAINHRDAILFLEEIVSQHEPLSEWSIRNIHQLVLKNVDNQNAGRYRQENVVISGAIHRPTSHVFVPEEMQRLIVAYHEQWPILHPVERATRLHGEFVKIHPFIDGNGRTARLLMNFELLTICKGCRKSWRDTVRKCYAYWWFSNLVVDSRKEHINGLRTQLPNGYFG